MGLRGVGSGSEGCEEWVWGVWGVGLAHPPWHTPAWHTPQPGLAHIPWVLEHYVAGRFGEGGAIAPCTMHCAPHCALCAVHCALCTVHLYTALYTLHCAPCTGHYAPCTMHCTLCTMHCALCTVHYALCTMNYALYTMHHALCTMHYAYNPRELRKIPPPGSEPAGQPGIRRRGLGFKRLGEALSATQPPLDQPPKGRSCRPGSPASPPACRLGVGEIPGRVYARLHGPRATSGRSTWNTDG